MLRDGDPDGHQMQLGHFLFQLTSFAQSQRRWHQVHAQKSPLEWFRVLHGT
jgi:hypothetical protein